MGSSASPSMRKMSRIASCRELDGLPRLLLLQAWEKCVDQARDKGEDFVDLCLDKTKALKECLEANPDYYAPVLVRHPVGSGTMTPVSRRI